MHIAFLLEDDAETGYTNVSGYVNGEYVAFAPSSTYPDGKLPISVVVPSNSFCVGGDHRTGNTSYFKGDIYSVAAYSDVRSQTEITNDMSSVDVSDEGLMAYYDLTTVTNSTTKIDNASTNDANNKYCLNLIETWMDVRRPALDDYAYSIALVGDTQFATEYDVKNGTTYVADIYKWLLDEKENRNIEFVVGLGDIVQGESVYSDDKSAKDEAAQRAEWTYAMEQIHTLDGKIPYSLIRGNHDSQAMYNEYVLYDDYKNVVGGAYNETMLNTWQELIVGDIKYLIMSVDLGASDEELAWAEDVIQTHPNHNVIISTHAYLNDDGTRLEDGDTYEPSQYPSAAYPSNRNTGEEMWNELFSQYDNIVMVVCGHVSSDDIVVTQEEGVNGNVVTQMLVDPQGLDYRLITSTSGDKTTPTGMICMLNFSADGKTVQVEQYSTGYDQWYMSTSQRTIELNVVKDANQKLLFNTQQMSRNTTRNWFERSGYTFALANYSAQAIVSSDEKSSTNVMSYMAPSDGFVRIRDMKVGFHTSQSTGMDGNGNAREFEFAVTNEKGKILSNHGNILVLNPDRTMVDNLSVEEYEIKKGEQIYFVIHGNAGYQNLVQCTPNIEFRVDGDDEWEGVSSLSNFVPWPKDTKWTDATAVQGMGGFYYHYSDSYEKVAYAEHNNKLALNTKLMTYTAGAGWPFTSDNSNCKTQIPQIVVGAGTTNVISYQADTDGYLWIDEMRVWQVNAATGYQVDFAVVNETGEVLTNNGEIYSIRYSKNADAKANLENLVVGKQEIKKGERIYFVFHGIEGITSVRCTLNILFSADDNTAGTLVNMGIDYANGMTLRKTGIDNTNIAQGTQDGDFFYGYSNVYEKIEEQKAEYIHIEAEKLSNMDDYGAHASFPYEQPNCSTKCMTRSGEIITSAGYTNVISYEALADGLLYIENMKVWCANKKADLKTAFSIVDENGKILTNNGQEYIIISSDADNGTTSKANAKELYVTKMKLEQGQRIYFVFHGLNGNVQSLRCDAKIMFSTDNGFTWNPANSDAPNSEMTLYSGKGYINGTTEGTASTPAEGQGVGGFHYQYLAANTTNVNGVKIGTEAEGTVTIYEKVESGKTYGDKYVVEADSAGNVKSYIDLDMLNVKKQGKVNDSNTELTDIRFIASVDNLSYKKVGFLFTKDAEIANDANRFTATSGEIKESANRSNTKVYTKMKDDGTYRKASNIYAEDGCNTAYGFAFELKKIPANDGTIYVRAYVLLEDGQTYVYGEPRAINVTAAGTVN